MWDRGVYEVIDPPGDAADAVRKGKIDINLHGFKLNGAFTLVHTGGRRNGDPKDKKNWLLIKKRDQYATTEDVFEAHPRSVLSGLTIEELADAPAAERKVADSLARKHLPELGARLKYSDFPLTLAKTVEDSFDNDKWLFEIKYDGVRVLAIREGENTHLYARKGTDITNRYPEVVLALNSIALDRFVLDGEIVAPDDRGRPSFQLLQRRMHVNDARSIARLSLAVPVNYYVFDLLGFDRFDTRTLPLEERKRLLGELIHSDGPVRYCDHVIGRGKDFYAAISEHELEGIVAKLRDSPYRGTRTGDWLKIKRPLTKHFVIGGYSDPDGTRTHFGALLLGQYESDGALAIHRQGRHGLQSGNIAQDLRDARGTRAAGIAVSQTRRRRTHAPSGRRISCGQSWCARFGSPNGPTAAASANRPSSAWRMTSIRAIASTMDRAPPAPQLDSVDDEVTETNGSTDVKISKGRSKAATRRRRPRRRKPPSPILKKFSGQRTATPRATWSHTIARFQNGCCRT